MGRVSTPSVSEFRGARTPADVPQALAGEVVRERIVPAGAPVLRQGEAPEMARILLDGHTYHHRIMSDGGRQITALQVLGEVCDLSAVLRGRADHGVSALTRCVFAEVPAKRLVHLAHSQPDVSRLLWRQILRQDAIAREWLVGMGRRTAVQRVAHLLCEVRVRLDRSGSCAGAGYRLDFTQAELADVLGLSSVHVNRVVQTLRRGGLIALRRGALAILDVPMLEMVAGFDPAYLGED